VAALRLGKQFAEQPNIRRFGQLLGVGNGPRIAGLVEVHGLDEIEDPASYRIPAYNYFDLTTRFNVTDHFELTLSAFNIFDKKAPIVGTNAGTTTANSGNTFPSTYDVLGRRYSATARIKF
jgi:outer membrane receptor protein involved in Fe transport